MTLWKTHTTELDPISSKYIPKTSYTLFNGSVFDGSVFNGSVFNIVVLTQGALKVRKHRCRVVLFFQTQHRLLTRSI